MSIVSDPATFVTFQLLLVGPLRGVLPFSICELTAIWPLTEVS